MNDNPVLDITTKLQELSLFFGDLPPVPAKGDFAMAKDELDKLSDSISGSSIDPQLKQSALKGIKNCVFSVRSMTHEIMANSRLSKDFFEYADSVSADLNRISKSLKSVVPTITILKLVTEILN